MKKYLLFLSVALICLGGFSQIPTAGLVAFSFGSDKYHNDWNGWDTDGNILEPGTYCYVLTVPDLKNDYKGFVYLKK